MALESTMICIDNSEHMRNSDFLPTRLQAQQDAINLVCLSKTRSNPGNKVGLLTLTNVRILVSLTSDVDRILAKLQQVELNGNINFYRAIKIASKILKYRLNRSHNIRIVAFVGSPIKSEEKHLVTLANHLKTENVNVDIIIFGEDAVNSNILMTFVNTLNGNDGTSSHFVTIQPDSNLSDALTTSAIIEVEDLSGATGLGGSGIEFEVYPNQDSDLASAQRISMEEERQRQEDEARRTAIDGESSAKGQEAIKKVYSEKAVPEQALTISPEDKGATTTGFCPVLASRVSVNFPNMTADEPITCSMLKLMLSVQKSTPTKEEDEKDEDYSEIINDSGSIHSVLENLPGVSQWNCQERRNLQDKKEDEKSDEK